MSTSTILLSSLAAILMAAIVAPGVIAMNRGKMLRNIAIWLAIFLLLGIVYNNFGPWHTAGISPVQISTDKSDPQIPEELKEPDGFNPPME